MSGRRGSTDRNFRARSLVRRPCGASARCPAGGISLRDARGQPGRPASSDPRASFRRTGSDSGRVVPTPAVCDRRVHPAAAARPDHDPLPDVIEVLERYAATGARTLASCTPEAGSDQVPFADYRACPGVCSRPPPGLRLRVSFGRVCRSHPRSTRTVSGCACPGHGWTTTSRPLTMHRWQGGYWYHRGRRAARCLGANRRTPCWRQPPQQARTSVANIRVVFHLSASRLVVNVVTGRPRGGRGRSPSYGTFGEHG